MGRPLTTKRAAVLALVLIVVAAAAPCPAAAQPSAQEAALYRELAGGLASWGKAVVDGRSLPEPTASVNATARPAAAAAKAATPQPPAGATPAVVAAAIGTLLAAASIESEVQGSLGSPLRWR